MALLFPAIRHCLLGLPNKKIYHCYKGREQGAGSRGRESRSEVQKLDNLFFGVPLIKNHFRQYEVKIVLNVLSTALCKIVTNWG
jgi:hypothetical protein